MLTVNVGCVAPATIVTPALSGMLPNRMATARMALRTRVSDLESHLIRGLNAKIDLDSAQALPC